jgi:hypothetical protein
MVKNNTKYTKQSDKELSTLLNDKMFVLGVVLQTILDIYIYI